MTSAHIIFLILLRLYISSQSVKCTSVCSVDGSVVQCTNKDLHRVPELPTYASYVDLSNNNISELNETSFSHLESLQVLVLMQQTPRLLIRNNTFRRLSNLMSLQLDYNHMLQMETGAFNGLPNLKILTLTHCGLDDSILSGDFLKPLVSLEKLVLRDNNIERIRPALFFLNLRRLHILDLSHTKVKSICEEDLFRFQGKHFTRLNLSSIGLQDMTQYWSGWDKCGNPFKNMSITILDLSNNGFEVNMAKLFFDAITGTKIHNLILSNSYSMGSLFGHNNLKNPDKFTFKGLGKSDLTNFDLSKSGIFALSYSLFGSLSDLEQITLAQNQINKIDNDAFLGMTNLLKLNLSNNFLGVIDSKTFQNLDKLQVLDLSYNHIWIVGYQSLQGLPNLLNLNLTGNVLKSVHGFASLLNLEQLYLGDNKITSFSSLPDIANNLTTLDLHSNQLTYMSDVYTTLQKFPQLVKIDLRDNVLPDCHIRIVFSDKLQCLDFGHTYMEVFWSKGICLDMFNNLHQLQYLSLKFSLLQSLPTGIFQGLTSLIFLDLSFNFLKYLPYGIFPKSLKILNLNSNSLYSVDPDLFSTLTHLSLLHNQFSCDCNLRDFQRWLNQTNGILVHPTEEVTCGSPEDQYMLPVLKSSIQCEEEEEEKNVEKLRTVLFICSAVLIMLLTASTIIYIRRRGYIFKLYKRLTARLVDGKQKEPEPDQFLYDVYLCFSSGDMKWVEKALLKRLDSQFSEQNTLHCCFEERDFIPGEDHLSNMRHAIQSSRKTLCVVSERFLKDGWCLETLTLAQCRMLVELKDVLLVLVVGNIPQYRLLKYEQVRSYIANRTYLLWPDDSQDLEWFYDQLIYKIKKDTKVKQTKEVEPKPEAINIHADTEV